MENLIKDVYLRKHMDSQGFVLLSFVAGFNRLKQISSDFDVIRVASQQSVQLEYRVGADGKDRVRKKEAWEKWVMPVPDRDPSAQNDGPGEMSFGPPSHHVDTSVQLRHASLPLPTSPMSAPGGFQSLNGVPPFASGFVNRAPVEVNGLGLQTSPTTMTVPAEPFVPSTPSAPLQKAADSGNRPEVAEQQDDLFPDKEIGALVVVWRRTDIDGPDGEREFPAPARTFSDGSVGGLPINGDVDTANGDKSLPNGHATASTFVSRTSKAESQ